MRDRMRQIVLLLSIVGGATGSSQGGNVVFEGADLRAGPTSPRPDGFNTTPGGSQFVQVSGGTLTFTFADPIRFLRILCGRPSLPSPGLDLGTSSFLG